MSSWDCWLDGAMKHLSHGVASHLHTIGDRERRALHLLIVILEGVQRLGTGILDETIEAAGLPGRHEVQPQPHPDQFVPGMLTLARSWLAAGYEALRAAA